MFEFAQAPSRNEPVAVSLIQSCGNQLEIAHVIPQMGIISNSSEEITSLQHNSGLSHMAKPTKRSNPIVLKHGMSIGSNAAETDDEFVFDCFIRYPPVERCMDVQSPGMIIAGRTGAGKTAILRYIERNVDHSIEIDPSEMSMSYVSNSDALNFLQTIGADLDLLFQVLWKHVTCIEFIRLRWSVNDEDKSKKTFARLIERFFADARKQKAIQYLRQWEGRFWITMDQNIKEITEKV